MSNNGACEGARLECGCLVADAYMDRISELCDKKEKLEQLEASRVATGNQRAVAIRLAELEKENERLTNLLHELNHVSDNAALIWAERDQVEDETIAAVIAFLRDTACYLSGNVSKPIMRAADEVERGDWKEYK
jgi:hypothetical protein